MGVNMIRVLIAEDEYLDNEGLKESIKSVHGDNIIIETVFSGFEAMDKLNSFSPDILISDINMPGMNGIELATKIKTSIPDINIIFISGYDDFEFLKSAIKLEAFEYILKPVDDNEINEVLNRVISKISNDKLVKEEDVVLRQIVSESIPIMQRKFLIDLIYGTIDNTDIWQKINNLHLEIQEGLYNIILFEVDDYLFIENEKKYIEKKLDDILCNINIEKYNICYKQSICIGNGRGAILLSFNSFILENTQKDTILNIAKNILSEAENELGKSITVSIGKSVLKIEEIYQSYDDACEKMLQKLILGKGTVISELSISQNQNIEYLKNSEFIRINKELIKCLQNLDKQKALHLLDYFFNNIRSYNIYNIKYIQNCCINIICQVQNYLFANNESLDDELEYELINWNNILKFDTIQDICNRMKEIFERVIECKINKKSNKAVDYVLKYIEEKFNEDITIKEIANELYYSQNHLGVLFKKETGKGFSEYLTEYRLKKAQELLKTTLLRTYQVSDAIGYTNVNSFIKQFKLAYGITPKEFRGRC